VLRYDLARSLKRPLDGGAEIGGRRLLGDNKTWRGAIVMWAGAAACALTLTRWAPFRDRLPPELGEAPAPAYAALLGAGVVCSELPTSFVKRRIGIGPGEQRGSPLGALISLYDQGDFVVGSAVALRPIWAMSRAQLAGAFLVVSGVHLVANVIGYAIGARTSPI
jgi:CDP-2,3-bis-(O-geranylgeranyl)-sn-glycerol synthase